MTLFVRDTQKKILFLFQEHEVIFPRSNFQKNVYCWFMLIDYLIVIIICFLICRKIVVELTREEAYFVLHQNG
jgi:hypothetical protein